MRRERISTEGTDSDPLLDRLCRLDQQVVYFPVRHHSPACAMFLGQLIRERKPAAVLIEGPADFNPDLDELNLPHQLPVAIYSYFRDQDDRRRGAFYPFCDHSPEWTALAAAREVGARRSFIDLPWSEVAGLDEAEHRYADGQLRRARYVAHLCEQFGVDTFDDLWDKLIEADDSLSREQFLQRVHAFCYQSRMWEEQIQDSDRRREAFMAECIRRELAATDGLVIVVTGGFHSAALAARLEGHECVGTDSASDSTESGPVEVADRGITLTPYTYQRLDNLSGYNAGMPSPGFYAHVWEVRSGNGDATVFDPGRIVRPLLSQIAGMLRNRKQAVSTADLIAVETTARALASLRGRTCVWRSDLLDAVTGSLLKDESAYGVASPFMDAVLRVMRGERQGKLAEGTRRPPLVEQIINELRAEDLEPTQQIRESDFNLLEAGELRRSRLLHQMRLLEIAGFRIERGPNFLERTDLSVLCESWRIHWSPEFDAACAEAARYGTSLDEAVGARLTERARVDSPNARGAAEILVDAALAGVDVINDMLLDQLEELIDHDGDFLGVSGALDHLLYLYCFDEVLRTAGLDRVGSLLAATFQRALWLLESLGQVSGSERELLQGLHAVSATFQRAEHSLALDRTEFLVVLQRIVRDPVQVPVVRGAVAGILWTLDEADPEEVVLQMQSLAHPEQLGDFLCGTFALAREVAQRHPQLVRSVDDLINGYDGDEFNEALPSLRLAYTYFTPREKHYMLSTLFESLEIRSPEPLAALEVDTATAAEALALESRVFAALSRYGLRGGDDES